MNKCVLAIVACVVVVGMMAPPCRAQQTNDTDRLLKVIEEQQRRLDTQEQQIREQKDALEVLRRQVEALRASGPPVTTASIGKSGSASYPGLEKSASAAQETWPGSFGVSGVNTRFKISGFIEGDFIHDNNAILTPSAFVTKAIVTGNATPAQGADGQTSFSVQPTRLELETRTPLPDRQLKTFVGVDFFNDFGGTTPELRLRQAYGEVSNLLFGGDVLIGQDWSTYANLYSIPNVLDFQGVNAVLGARHLMGRWTKDIGNGLALKLAVEAPDLRLFENARSASAWPDGVVALNWANDVVNLQGSFLARDLRAEGDTTGNLVSTFGWVASLAGRVYMPGAFKQDFATFQLCYGEGYGGLLNDTPADAAYDAGSNEFEAIETLAWHVGYQHWWNPRFYSVITYGQIWQDNTGFQAPTAYKRTQYSSVNLTWTPFAQWLIGMELLYGTREDKNGDDGYDLRTQVTTRFMF